MADVPPLHEDRSADSLEAARALALQVAATHPEKCADIWKHTGGKGPGHKKLLPTHRLLVLEPDDAPPKYGWEKVERVQA